MKNTGRRLERLVRAVGKRLQDEQRAKLWKLPNDLRVLPEGQVRFGEAGPCDFVGHTSAGRVVMLECKQVKGPRLSLGGKGHVRPHQLRALLECGAAGGVGLLVWQHGDELAVIAAPVLLAFAARRSLPWAMVPASVRRPATEDGLLELLEPYLPAAVAGSPAASRST